MALCQVEQSVDNYVGCILGVHSLLKATIARREAGVSYVWGVSKLNNGNFEFVSK